MLPVLAPSGRDHRVALAPLLFEALEFCEGVVGVGGGVDRPQVLGHGPAVAVVDVAQARSDLVDDAGLHPGLGEDGLDRLGEPAQSVDAGDQDIVRAAALEVVQHGQPELRALGLLPPDPQDLAVAVAGHPHREVAGAGPDGAVLADLHEHRVEVDDRVDALQRPRAPCRDVLQDGVGDPADGVAADLGGVELGQVRRDVTHRHAAGVEGEDLVVQPGQPSLAFLDQLRLKAAVAVARGADLDGPQIGAHRLGGRTVADIRAARDTARRVTEVSGQLGLQRRLDHAAGQLRQQPARPGDLLALKALQGVLQGLLGQQAGQTVDDRLSDPLIRLLGASAPAPLGLHIGHGDE